MPPLDYPFRVQTASSRRPTPTEFVHLRKWAAPEEKFLRLTSSEEITNIVQQFDETDIFNVSNIFQRALSFIFGQTDLGPRIIQGTLDGALHVAIADDFSGTQTLERAKIDIASSGDNTIITGTTAKRTHICNMMFTVAGEVNIIFKSGTTDITGPMDFGGANEPKGMVCPLGLGPLLCNSGEAFKINLSAAVQVSGFCTFFKKLV